MLILLLNPSRSYYAGQNCSLIFTKFGNFIRLITLSIQLSIKIRVKFILRLQYVRASMQSQSVSSSFLRPLSSRICLLDSQSAILVKDIYHHACSMTGHNMCCIF